MTGLWKRSTACATGECIEIQISPTYVFLRNAAGGPVVTASHAEWTAFCAGAAAGEFVLPTPTETS